MEENASQTSQLSIHFSSDKLRSLRPLINFWLKKSRIDNAGEVLALERFILYISEIISKSSVIDTVSDLPQLTKFLYKLVTEPDFRTSLVSKRASLAFCRCLYVFIRNKGLVDNSQQQHVRMKAAKVEEIRSKSREWAQMVLRLSLNPRSNENSTEHMRKHGTSVVKLPSYRGSVSASIRVVNIFIKRELIALINYHCSRIENDTILKNFNASDFNFFQAVDIHWNCLRNIGLFLLSYLQPGIDEEAGKDDLIISITRHWLLMVSHITSLRMPLLPSMMHLQLESLDIDLSLPSYINTTLELKVPNTISLPIPAEFHLISENVSLLEEFIEKMKDMVLDHSFLAGVFLDSGLIPSSRKILYQRCLDDFSLWCWIRKKWSREIEKAKTDLERRILICFLGESIQDFHCSSTIKLTELWMCFSTMRDNHSIDVKDSESFPVQDDAENIAIHTKNIGLWMKEMSYLVKKHYWENVTLLEHNFVVACLRFFTGLIGLKEFKLFVNFIIQCLCVHNASKGWKYWRNFTDDLMDYVVQHLTSIQNSHHFSPKFDSNNGMEKLLVDITLNIIYRITAEDYPSESCIELSFEQNKLIPLLYLHITEWILQWSTRHYQQVEWQQRLESLYQRVIGHMENVLHNNNNINDLKDIERRKGLICYWKLH